ncbi:MAG: hypothetical protein FJ088_16435, partial [Deltaproteobacteria bacterium]|nr:hypothetical protein [Deltaproteobacteria bacterium]
MPVSSFADHVLSVFAGDAGKIAVHAVETDFVHGFHRDYIQHIDAPKGGKPSLRKYLVPDKDFDMLKRHQETEIYNDERETAIKNSYETLEKAGYSQMSPAKLTGEKTFSFKGAEYSLNIALKKDFQFVNLKKTGEKKERQVF